MISAHLRDVTGSYDTSFYFLGTVALLAAILTLSQQLALRYRGSRDDEVTVLTTTVEESQNVEEGDSGGPEPHFECRR